jgi:tRNA G26 N,N-dimethylase Trm1
VAVRAEHPQVFEAIVMSIAVDVVDLDGYGPSPPIADATTLAAVCQNTGLK